MIRLSAHELADAPGFSHNGHEILRLMITFSCQKAILRLSGCEHSLEEINSRLNSDNLYYFFSHPDDPLSLEMGLWEFSHDWNAFTAFVYRPYWAVSPITDVAFNSEWLGSQELKSATRLSEPLNRGLDRCKIEYLGYWLLDIVTLRHEPVITKLAQCQNHLFCPRFIYQRFTIYFHR